MNKQITKILCLTLAVGLFPFSSCGSLREPMGSTLEISMETSWHSDQIQMNSGWEVARIFGDTVIYETYNGGQMQKYDSLMYHDLATDTKTEITPQCVETRTKGNAIAANLLLELDDGNLGLVCTEYKEGFTQPNTIIGNCLEVYDREMQYLETRDVPKEFADAADWTGGVIYSYYTWQDNDGYIYTTDHDAERMYIFNPDLTLKTSFSTQNQPVGDKFVPAKDGGMYFYIGKTEDDGNTPYYAMYHIDSEGAITELDVYIAPQTVMEASEDGMGGYVFFPRYWTFDIAPCLNGEYDYYYLDASGIYGMKDMERTMILSWLNSDFEADDCTRFYTLEDGRFLADFWDESGANMWLASPRTEEEIENTKLISLATLGLFPSLKEAIMDYNRAENGYRIVVEDYSLYNTREDSTIGEQKLREDMLDGIVADMICTNDMNFESLASKGMFGDWYKLMDADETFNREDYLTNFFEAYEYDDELQRLGVSYTVLTSIAKTEHVGTEQGIGTEAYFAYADSIPETMDFTDFSAFTWGWEGWFRSRLNFWIDPYTASCNFDNPSFVKLLEMVDEGVTLEDTIRKTQDWTIQETVYNSAKQEVWMASQEDRQLFYYTYFDHPIDYRAVHRTEFRDADITLTGYPMDYDQGNGGVFWTDFTLSYNPQSKETAAIWDMVKHLLSEEYQKRLTDSMPVHLGMLDKKLEEATKMVTARIDFGGQSVQFGEATEEEMAEFKSYLQGIRTCYYQDGTVTDIILEEFDRYHAGDCTAEEAAKSIQSRVTIYLSEQS